jgi:hypothetical protein
VFQQDVLACNTQCHSLRVNNAWSLLHIKSWGIPAPVPLLPLVLFCSGSTC